MYHCVIRTGRSIKAFFSNVDRKTRHRSFARYTVEAAGRIRALPEYFTFMISLAIPLSYVHVFSF